MAIGFGYGANMLTEYPTEVREDTQTSYQDASIQLGKEWAKAEGELTGHHHCGDRCVVGSGGEYVGSTVFGTTTDYMFGGFLSPSYLRYMEIKQHPQEIASKSQWRKILESPWGSPIPIGDGDGDVNRFPDGDGDGDRDEAEKQGWRW
ncbi:hypothetical protein Tco_0652445 [Tanacetum coccineum]|uniref:Uncharacterized protein n=1 Tax=Tanacetum coccineum TaxID=301880 RepID=A0ABQ4WYA0_9ASTR